METPDGVLDSFLDQWANVGLRALAILAPDTKCPQYQRPLIVRPIEFTNATHALVEDAPFGADWPTTDHASVVWTNTDRGGTWHHHWRELGILTVVRIAKELPGNKQIEVIGGFDCQVNRDTVARFTLFIASSATQLRSSVLVPLSGLSVQQLRVLQLSMVGHLAKECAAMMGVTERTVNHHLSVVQQKLSSQSKIESIAKAIWLGVL